jgi:hypothetical protein
MICCLQAGELGNIMVKLTPNLKVQEQAGLQYKFCYETKPETPVFKAKRSWIPSLKE